MSDERKREQQRKLTEFMAKHPLSIEAGQMLREWHDAINAAIIAEREQEKVADALCGPYGRFFNEGTD